MAFQNRREILFLYTVKDANPNGDPLNQNHPRYDEDTQQVLVSDVRIKRTIRDQWVQKGKNVFIDGESKTLKTRFEELKKITGLEKADEVLGNCIDTRLFGITFALDKESFAWTGPVQFKWGRSLHAASFEFIQGTAAFATKEGSQQRSFRNEYKVPFVLIGVYGIANQYAASKTGAQKEDFEELSSALWKGTDNLITRSKNEHKARFYLEIIYKKGFDSKIGSLDQKIKLLSQDGQELSMEEQKKLRSLKECLIDLSQLISEIEKNIDNIEKIKIKKDAEICLKGEKELTKLTVVEVEMR